MDATAAAEESAPATDEAMIRLEGVGKTYADGTVAVHELDLEVAAGELVVLVGPSGCGKSTTLKMINRLIEPTSGRIFIEGRDVTSRGPGAAATPDRLRDPADRAVPPPEDRHERRHRAVADREPKAQAHDRALELLDLVGLDPKTFADRYPRQLSGGQQQRVGVARALAADPPVLLMDEPFAAVDPIVRARLQDEFLRLQEELGKTVVLVTHDIDEAVKMGDKVAVLAQGGRLAQFATPAELLGHPADDFVADFVGSTAGLRRLTVTKLDPHHLEPLDGVATGDLAAAIDLDSTLEHALAVLLRDDQAVVGVKDGARFVGVLTPDGIHRALRASLASELAVGTSARRRRTKVERAHG